MSNARFSILQARAVKDKRISDSQFRTLAALGMYADENGWCYPSLGTLANDLSKSKQAVGRDTIALRKLGYLEVKARFDPKTKARRSSLYRLRFDLPPINMGDSTPSTSEVDDPSIKLVDTPSTSEVDVNDPINDPSNDLKEEEARNPLFSLYENSLGMLTPRIADWLEEAEKIYSFEWVSEAITIAARNGAKSWNYCESILKRWKQEGKSERPGKKQTAAQSGDPNKYIKGEYAHLIEH